MCELGWPGIAISEEYGGQGLGLVELVILCEEMGYACAPSPFISNAIAGLAIEGWGTDEQKKPLASRDRLRRGARGGRVHPRDAAGGRRRRGRRRTRRADRTRAGGWSSPDDAELERLDLIDRTRAYYRVSASRRRSARGRSGVPGMVALAAESVGVAQRALDMAVEYAKEREQFGRPIGAYQAVSHRCAQMLYDTEEARSLTYYAAWCGDAEPESLPLAAHMAKARASDAASSVTNAALQVFGGIGFTWEHDLQFLLKRAAVSAQLLGSSSRAPRAGRRAQRALAPVRAGARNRRRRLHRQRPERTARGRRGRGHRPRPADRQGPRDRRRRRHHHRRLGVGGRGLRHRLPHRRRGHQHRLAGLRLAPQRARHQARRSTPRSMPAPSASSTSPRSAPSATPAFPPSPAASPRSIRCGPTRASTSTPRSPPSRSRCRRTRRAGSRSPWSGPATSTGRARARGRS